MTARTSYAKPKQRYLADTNILLTRFQGKDAVGEVIDFMVPDTSPGGRSRALLIRQARAVRGRARFEVACHPAFDYGRTGHEVEIVAGVGVVFTSPADRAVLRTSVHPDPGLLARLAGPVPLHRPLAGDGAPVRPRAQAAGLPPDRGAGGGADDVAARRAGRDQEHFPQAFTHLALISAAVNLDQALNRR
jgi:GH15 family glucan-1,4-alpha-glucosidase